MHRTYKSDAIIIGFGNLSNLDDGLSKYGIPNYIWICISKCADLVIEERYFNPCVS